MLGKRTMFLVALLVGLCMPMMAGEASRDFSKSNYNQYPGLTGTLVYNNTTYANYSVIKNTGTNNPVKPSSSQKYLRMYTGNLLTITAIDGYVIAGVTFTCSSSYTGGTKTVTTYDGNTQLSSSYKSENSIAISENANKVTISGASEMRITKITVTYKQKSSISFSQDSYTLSVGGTQQLSPTRTPSNATVKYVSANENIATVTTSNNRTTVTAKGYGETKITATIEGTEDYTSSSASIIIYVTKPTPTASLTAGSTELAVGGTTSLTFTTNSTGQKSYRSENTSVATVNSSSGVVTAVGVGTAVITATVAESSNYSAVSKTINITVKNAATATVSAENATLAVGGTTQLNVTTNSNGKKTYTSSNTNVATVDDYGKVTAKSAGTATITVNIAATQTYAATSATVQITVEGPEELDGNGATVYYIRNVSTGLYIKYGGSYGMDAIEGRAAHPFKLYLKGTDSKGNKIYSLASIHGYFNSMYSNASLFMDRPESESNWTFEPAENTSDVYYLRGENSKALASVGNQYGILEFRTHDTKDIYQKWQLITEDKLREEMAGATVVAPVDITPFIKGAAFDYADHKQPGNQFFTAEETPFYGEITEEAGSLPWNNTPVEERIVGNGLGAEDAEHSEWQLTHSYVNYWDGFKRMEHYGARWSDDPSVGSNTNLNGIGLSRNNIHNEYMVEQYIGELPAGTYVLSYQGFYATTYSGEVPTVSVATATGDADLADEFSEKLDNYTNSSIRSLLSSSADNRGLYVATMFRDNRENDSYRGSIQFKLTEPKHVGIRIHKNRTNPETGGSIGSRYQWMIAFDDFTLIYQGNENTEVDQAILYYDRVKAAYLYYSKKVSELGEPASYTGCHLDGCVHWTAWDNAINGVVTVNGLNLRGNEYTTPSQKFAYLNGTAASNKIDTEKEFLEALSKIEAAYQAALKEHNSHLTNFTGLIENPCFEEGFTKNYQDGIDRAVSVDVKGWNRVFVYGWHDNVWYDQDENVIMSTGATTAHDDYYFNSWRGVHGKEAVPIQQDIKISEAGLYELSALVSTYAKGDDGWDNGGAITDYTVFLTAGTYHSGVVPHSKDNFVEHKLLFLVEQDNTEITIGAVGGDGNNFNFYDPRGGGFFRADCFKLTKVSDVPNGRVRLALDEVKKITLDKYGQEVINLSEYENMVNNNLVTGDGTAEVAQLYKNMKEATLAQKTREADMTWAITNANFELGETGWTFTETPENWETGVFPHDKAKASVGADGSYLFNTWSATGANCKEITQTISGLRNGTYRLSAMVASTNGNKMTIKAGTASGQVTCIGDNDMVEVSCDFTITGGPSQEVKIGVYNNATWYKVDNFRLTFLGHELDLDHATKNLPTYKDWYTKVNIKRPVASKKWHSFVVPFDMPVPENWDVRKLVNSTVDETGEHIFLDFSEVGEVKIMEAGVPYMVRYYPDGIPSGEQSSGTETDATIESIVVENVDVDTEEHNVSEVSILNEQSQEKGKVSFEGTYKEITLDPGYFYVSNNQFYVSKGKTTMKGYRGYFTIEGVNVKSIGMRTGRETGVEPSKTEDVTVVGIYDVNGVRRDELSEGLNIVRMSNGTTIKMMIK